MLKTLEAGQKRKCNTSEGHERPWLDKHIVAWERYSEFKCLSKGDQIIACKLGEKGAWLHMIGRVPKHFVPMQAQITHIVVSKGRMKIFRHVMISVTNDQNSYPIAIKLASLFRDLNTLKRACPSISDYHDYSEFDLFGLTSLTHDWGSVVIKYPEVLKYTADILRYEDEFGKFTSINKFIAIVSTYDYPDTVKGSLLELCRELDVGPKTASKYAKFFDKHPSKSYESVPSVTAKHNGYIMCKLDHDDMRGPFLGLQTACCQHLGSVGSPCAKAGYRDGESAFYVVHSPSGKIIAQSWVWRSTDDSIVFDSIESRKSSDANIMAHLYRMVGERLIGKLGVKRCLVGNTSYGVTKNVKIILDRSGHHKAPKMIREVSYTDAEDVWSLA